MTEITIIPSSWQSTWWAVGRDFEYLPDVDPAFSPQKMSGLRRFLLRAAVVPMNFQRKARGYILIADGKPAAYMFLRQRGSSLNIESVGVLAGNRRNGFGRKLVEKAEQVARQDKLDYLTASITPQNEPAKAFFQSLGFESFRSQIYRLSAEDIQAGIDDANDEQRDFNLRELGAMETLPVYQRMQRQALNEGAPELAEMLADSLPRYGFKAAARHWTCLVDGEQVGYLRIAGLAGRYSVYLVCSREYWDSRAQVLWLKQALQIYPQIFLDFSIDMPTDAHFKAARQVWEDAGFEAIHRQRYLLIRTLESDSEDQRVAEDLSHDEMDILSDSGQ